jgi:hypothetical protein
MLSSNRVGRWERVSSSDAIVWTRAPIIQPFIGSIELASKRFVFAGVSPQAVTNTPPPSGTLTDLKSIQNAVYYDREITGPRVESWMFMSQLFRIILRREQLPDGARSVAWLKAAGPNLGPATTTLTKVSSTELVLSRKSTVGLNSIELHLLADWLESPEFPFEPFTVAMKMPPLRARGAPAGGPR